MQQLNVGGVEIAVQRKPIRQLRLVVYPPHGLVRVAAPLAISDEAIRRAVTARLEWIRRQLARFEDMPRRSRPAMISGESHFFLGQGYRLDVTERQGPARVSLSGSTVSINLDVQPATSVEDRTRVLDHWYRGQLKLLIPPLLARWQPVIGVQAAEWGIRKMKTRWGSCNIRARRIWLGLGLIEKPAECLEYVLVHELVHLLERRHNQRFVAYMDRFLPTWRLARGELNRPAQGSILSLYRQ